MVTRARQRAGAVVPVDEYEPLVREARACALLHVAGHAVFNGENPYRSGVKLLRGGRSSGLMTVADCMSDVTLDACRLAVLSACESGVARPHGGGELTSLPNALLLAGAKSVIASLWIVPDAAGAMLMHHIYDEWQGGLGKEFSAATALATARQKLKRSKRAEVVRVLGTTRGLPRGPVPFAHPVYADAFQCFGSL